jgi:hypothetical protein
VLLAHLRRHLSRMISLRRKPRPLLDPAELVIEPIEVDAIVCAAREAIAALERRLAETEQRRSHAVACKHPPNPGRGVAARARDLLAGGRIPGVDPNVEIEACAEEGQVLRAEINATNARLHYAVGEASLRVCAAHSDLHRSAELASPRGSLRLWPRSTCCTVCTPG